MEKPLTKRIKVKELEKQGLSPKQYVHQHMTSRSITNCTIEVSNINGNSFIKPQSFQYSMGSIAKSALEETITEEQINVPLTKPPQKVSYVNEEGFLAKHYEKWYDEEVDKNRKLRLELEQTLKELYSTKSELHFLSLRTEIENKQKDYERRQKDMERDYEWNLEKLEWEREKQREAKSGLNGIFETINNNTFLQGLLEKVITNFMDRKPSDSEELNGIPKVDDPVIQQAFNGIVNGLEKLSTDKEHFGAIALILDKVSIDKETAQKTLAWLNNKPTPRSSSKAPSISDCL